MQSEQAKSQSEFSGEFHIEYDISFGDFAPKDIEMFQDKAAIIQSWLLGEGIPSLEDNQQVLSYAGSEHDLEIFFYFILNPFCVPPSDRAKRRFGRSQKTIKIEPKRTYLSNSKFIYVPEKHNIQFMRAQKMLYVFMLRKNLFILRRHNQYFIDIFYKVAADEVFENERCRVDMTQVLSLVQYFLVADPLASIRNIIKYHLMFEFLGNIEILSSREILTSLMSPGDQLFKITDAERKYLVDYMLVTNFMVTMTNALVSFKISSILADKIRVAKEDKVKAYIKDVDKRSRFKTESKAKNLFIGFFHSFLNVNNNKKHMCQPEELYNNLIDIDWLASYNQPIKLRRLSRNNTIGNISQVLDEYDQDGTEGISQSNAALTGNFYAQQASRSLEVTEKDIEEGTSPVLVDHLDQLQRQKTENGLVKVKKKKWEAKFRGVIRFVMCHNLFLDRPQMMSKQRKDRWGFSFVPYPENIQISNHEIKMVQMNPKLYFEKCAKTESKANKIIEIINSCITNSIIHRKNADFMKAIRQNVSTADWIPELLFKNERLLFELLKTFIIKIQFHLENKTLFMSGYWAGRVFVDICKDM